MYNNYYLVECKHLPLLLFQKYLPSLHDRFGSPLLNSSFLLLRQFLGVTPILHIVDGEVQNGVFFHSEQLKTDMPIAFSHPIVLSPAKKKTSDLSQRSLVYCCDSSWYAHWGIANLSRGVQLYHPFIDKLVPPGTILTGVQDKPIIVIQFTFALCSPGLVIVSLGLLFNYCFGGRQARNPMLISYIYIYIHTKKGKVKNSLSFFFLSTEQGHRTKEWKEAEVLEY